MRVQSASLSYVVESAKKFFDMAPPFNLEALKTAFRRASHDLYPDKGGNQEAFIKMKQAYDVIVSFRDDPSLFGDGSNPQKGMRTIDGTWLHELGLGLGPMKNGVDCEVCNHRGYTEIQSMDFRKCSACEGECWISLVPCGDCKGSKKFTQKSGRVVECYRCRGAGMREVRPFQCIKCNGRGDIYEAVYTQYIKCTACVGMGEVEIYNPVIPRGRLFR